MGAGLLPASTRSSSQQQRWHTCGVLVDESVVGQRFDVSVVPSGCCSGLECGGNEEKKENLQQFKGRLTTATELRSGLRAHARAMTGTLKKGGRGREEKGRERERGECVSL